MAEETVFGKKPDVPLQVVNDPLRDLLNAPALTYSSEEEIPDDIKGFLESNGLNDKTYRVMLKRAADGVGLQPGGLTSACLKNYPPNTIPTHEHIAMDYGPGDYLIVFSWRIKGEDGKVRNKMEQIALQIDETYRDDYDEYQLKKSIARAQRQKKIIDQMRLRNEMQSHIASAVSNVVAPSSNEPKETVSPVEAGKKYIQETVEAAKMLGLSNQKGFDWEKVFAIVLPMLPSIIQMFTNGKRAESEKLEKVYTLLMAQQSESTKQLLEVLRTQQGPNNGSDVMKEMRDMIFGAIDIKEALQGGKTSVADRIFQLVEGVAPQVLQLAMMGQAQRQQDIRYKMAKTYMANAPEFTAMRQDPQIQAEVVHKLDADFGWEQTDIILNVGGLARPQTCPRLPNQRFPKGDERNNAPEAPQEAIQEDIQDATIVEDDNPMGEMQ